MSGRSPVKETETVPILKVEDVLLATPQWPIHDRMAVQFRENILENLTKTRAKGLILDIGSIDIVDSFLGRIIGEIAESATLMGTTVVVIGINPSVAITIVEMGFTFKGVHMALNMEKGLAFLRKQQEKQVD